MHGGISTAKLAAAALKDRWHEKAGLRGMRYAPNVRRARGAIEKETGYEKTSAVRVNRNVIFKGHKLTIGMDLGDHWSFYCVLDEPGKIILEQKVATTAEAMKQTFERIPRGLIAMETKSERFWLVRMFEKFTPWRPIRIPSLE